MSFQFIKTGDQADITLKTYENSALPSRVENVLDFPELLVRAPVINGRYRVLPDGLEISLTVYTEKGVYKFESVVTGSAVQNGFGILRVNLGEEGERVQRRNFFRMDCLIPFCFKPVTDTAEILNPQDAEKGVILDISGGGMRFVSQFELMEGMLIKGLIEMETKPAIVTGKILFARQMPNAGKFQYRVRFDNLPDEISEQIVQYVLQLQRDQLRREQNFSFYR